MLTVNPGAITRDSACLLPATAAAMSRSASLLPASGGHPTASSKAARTCRAVGDDRSTVRPSGLVIDTVLMGHTLRANRVA